MDNLSAEFPGMELREPCMMELPVYSDGRGFLVPLTNDLRDLQESICRVYVVGNYGKGVIRGFHFHAREIKMFYIASGAGKFVIINPSNPEEDRHTFVISERKPGLVIIPAGYANGWVSLEDNTILVALSTSTYEESVADDKRYDPYKWGDVWTVEGG